MFPRNFLAGYTYRSDRLRLSSRLTLTWKTVDAGHGGTFLAICYTSLSFPPGLRFLLCAEGSLPPSSALHGRSKSSNQLVFFNKKLTCCRPPPSHPSSFHSLQPYRETISLRSFQYISYLLHLANLTRFHLSPNHFSLPLFCCAASEDPGSFGSTSHDLPFRYDLDA